MLFLQRTSLCCIELHTHTTAHYYYFFSFLDSIFNPSPESLFAVWIETMSLAKQKLLPVCSSVYFLLSQGVPLLKGTDKTPVNQRNLLTFVHFTSAVFSSCNTQVSNTICKPQMFDSHLICCWTISKRQGKLFFFFETESSSDFLECVSSTLCLSVGDAHITARDQRSHHTTRLQNNKFLSWRRFTLVYDLQYGTTLV